MNERIKHVLPNDRLKLVQNDAFFTDAETVLTLLYQPLIGANATSLFQFFASEVSIQHTNASYSHHHVMNMLNMTLDDFYEARKKLEGIGLLRTYKESGTFTTFYYLLQRPFSAQAFFGDSMLSVLLEHQVGKDTFHRLRKKLCTPFKLPEGVEHVTHTFDEVFTTVQPKHEPPVAHISEGRIVEKTKLPLDWLHKMLSQQNVNPNQILTKSNLTFIEKMMKVYDVNVLELETALIWAVTEDSSFERKEFHAMCKDIYYKKHGSVPPRLYQKDQAIQMNGKEQPNTKPKTKKDQLIQHFESITHRELLEDYSSSGVASMKEVDMITDIMVSHNLPQPVINVLVDYVLKRNQNKLTKNYLETIAAHWSRENISTVQAAMEIAKREHTMYQKWQQKNQNKQSPHRKSKSSEVLPKWYKDKRETQTYNPKPQADQSPEELQKKKKELEEFFQRFSK